MNCYKIWGVKLEKEDFNKIAQYGKLSKTVVDFLELQPYDVDVIDQKDLVKLLFSRAIPLLPSNVFFFEDGEDCWMGRDFTRIKNDETGSEFRKSIQDQILTILGPGKHCKRYDIIIED